MNIKLFRNTFRNINIVKNLINKLHANFKVTTRPADLGKAEITKGTNIGLMAAYVSNGGNISSGTLGQSISQMVIDQFSDPIAVHTDGTKSVLPGLDSKEELSKGKYVYMKVSYAEGNSDYISVSKLSAIPNQLSALKIYFENIMDPINTDIKAAVERALVDMQSNEAKRHRQLIKSQGSTKSDLILDSNEFVIGLSDSQDQYQTNSQSIITELHQVIQKTIAARTNKITTPSAEYEFESNNMTDKQVDIFKYAYLSGMIYEIYPSGETRKKTFYARTQDHVNHFIDCLKEGEFSPYGNEIKLSDIDPSKAVDVLRISFKNEDKWFTTQDPVVIKQMLEAKNKFLTLENETVFGKITGAGETAGPNTFEVLPDRAFIVEACSDVLTVDAQKLVNSNTDSNGNNNLMAVKKGQSSNKSSDDKSADNTSKTESKSGKFITMNNTLDTSKLGIGQVVRIKSEQTSQSVKISGVIIFKEGKNIFVPLNTTVNKDTGIEIKDGTVKVVPKGGVKNFVAVSDANMTISADNKGIIPLGYYYGNEFQGPISGIKFFDGDLILYDGKQANVSASDAADLNNKKKGLKVDENGKLVIVEKSADCLADTTIIQIKSKEPRLIDGKGELKTEGFGSGNKMYDTLNDTFLGSTNRKVASGVGGTALTGATIATIYRKFMMDRYKQSSAIDSSNPALVDPIGA